jgi:RHH-type proline utilization regulon transcriptional repressor/proline dehydrogenase/delta 1-pyrroline-5-carboxylate dehydrogenase
MSKPNFKLNLFRLVDVLPALKTEAAVVKHVSEYLGEAAGEFGDLAKWSISAKAGSLKAKLLAFAVKTSIYQMADLFIAGSSAKSAIPAIKSCCKEGFTFTADLLGEYSLSEEEAKAYLNRYLEAVEILGKEVPNWKIQNPQFSKHIGNTFPANVSVKLSALYSQVNILNFEKSVEIISERLTQIALAARKNSVMLYVDAEDSAHNPIIYECFKRVFSQSIFAGFPYPGIVLQAYDKNSEARLYDLLQFAKNRNNPIAVRLVKVAYWDQETVKSKQKSWESP